MSRLWSVPLVSLLAACSGGAEGTWEGECVYDFENSVELFIELDSAGSKASGDAVGAFDTSGYLDILSGIVTGSASGSTVELNIEFEDETELDLTGERDGEEISGDCVDSNGNEGDLELEREG